MDFRLRQHIREDISKVYDVLYDIKPSDRLHVIAEALMDLNPHGKDRILQSSCGCYDWDISMDYRPHDERYPKKENDNEIKS